MTLVQRILILVLSLGILAFTIELIRRRRLREEYALLWILTGTVVLIFAMFPRMLYFLSELYGLHHLTTLLFVTFLFLLTIILHYSTVISRITERETELAQRLAILEFKIQELAQPNHGSEEEDGA
jgi:hypothetical protein